MLRRGKQTRRLRHVLARLSCVVRPVNSRSSARPALIFQGPQYWKREQPMKIERGVMVMKDGKAWGISYDDGRSKSYGWIDPEDAPIHNPKHCKSVTAVTYQNSPDIAELKTGKLVSVERRTEVVLT